MKRLLFTGGGGAGNEAIYRLWKQRYDLHFADACPEGIAPDIPAPRRHRIPMADEADFSEAVAELCLQLEADVLVPAVDEELEFSPRVTERAPALRVLGPEPQYVSAMLDKLDSLRRLAEQDIDVPTTVTAQDAESVGFPCVLKPRRGRGSRGFWIAHSREQVDAYLALHGCAPADIVAQELLSGQEYTVMMAADARGRLRAVVPVEVAEKRGVTIRARTRAEPNVIRACETIHQRLPTRGCYNIQLMLSPAGRAAPFEINPRISTTFCLAAAAGIDAVDIFCGEGGSGEGLLPFVDGCGLQRSWHNHFDIPAGELP